eukprot:tig00020562_g11135.t1
MKPKPARLLASLAIVSLLALLFVLLLDAQESRESPRAGWRRRSALQDFRRRFLAPDALDREDELAVAVLTTARFHETRTSAIRATWGRQLSALEYFSDSTERLPGAHVLRPQPSERFGGGGAWKDLPALQRLYELHPNKKWYMRADDDTFVIVPNLLNFTRRLNASREQYVGQVNQYGLGGTWFGQGGGGYLLSAPLMQRLHKRLDECIERLVHIAYGDSRVGICVDMMGGPRPNPMKGGWFHGDPIDMIVQAAPGGNVNASDPSARERWHGHARRYPNELPVSFHRLDPNDVRDLHAFVSRGGGAPMPYATLAEFRPWQAARRAASEEGAAERALEA